MPNHRLLRAAVVLASLVAITSCSTSPESPTAPMKHAQGELRSGSIGDVTPAQPAPALVAELSVSKLVDGRVGDVLTVGRWKVVVPKGAFNGVGTITVRVPDPSLDRCDLTIYPQTLNRFSEPVDLRFMCDSMAEANARSMKWWDPQNQRWVHIDSWANASDVSRCAPLKHFSTYSSGKAGW